MIATAWFTLPKNVRVAVILFAAVAAWQACVVAFEIPELLVPTPTKVIAAIWKEPQFYLFHTWRTLYETLVGFGIAVVVGVLLSILVISSRFLEETIYTLLVVFNGIPKVAIAPLFVVWMGTGLLPKFAISATIAIFVIVIDLVLGFRSVDPPKSCEWRVLYSERLILLKPQSLEGTDVRTLLQQNPFIRYDARVWGGLLVDGFLRKIGIRPKERFELDALDAIAVLVDRGLGVALVPDWPPPWPEGLSIAKVPVGDPAFDRHIGLVWARANPRLRLVKALLEEMEKQKKENAKLEK